MNIDLSAAITDYILELGKVFKSGGTDGRKIKGNIHLSEMICFMPVAATTPMRSNSPGLSPTVMLRKLAPFP